MVPIANVPTRAMPMPVQVIQFNPVVPFASLSTDVSIVFVVPAAVLNFVLTGFVATAVLPLLNEEVEVRSPPVAGFAGTARGVAGKRGVVGTAGNVPRPSA